MRILIVGGAGMLGSQCLRHFRDQYEVKTCVRGPAEQYQQFELFDQKNTFFDTDVHQIDVVTDRIKQFQPEAIINCIGIVKQRTAAQDAQESIKVNALFPHQLAQVAEQYNARVITFSTDCVFSGLKGNYSEQDLPDPKDTYGRSKLLGELYYDHCVTIRSSIIGLELTNFMSLISWYLGQTGKIKGFTRAIYTGFTTIEMARIIERILTQHQDICGLWQIASDPINKFELLKLFGEQLGRDDIQLEPDAEFFCDRSLDGSRFNQQTGYQPPTWQAMLTELAAQVKSSHLLTELS